MPDTADVWSLCLLYSYTQAKACWCKYSIPYIQMYEVYHFSTTVADRGVVCISAPILYVAHFASFDSCTAANAARLESRNWWELMKYPTKRVNKNKIFTYRINNNIALKVFKCWRIGINLIVLKSSSIRFQRKSPYSVIAAQSVSIRSTD